MPQAGVGDTYAGAALYDESSSDAKRQLQGLFAGGVAGQVAGTNLSVQELLAQIGMIAPELNTQDQQALSQEGYGEANALLGMEQLGLQGQGLQAQEGLLNTQYGIQQKTLQGQEQLAGTQYGLSQQDIAAQRAQQGISYGNQVSGTQNQLASSGALNSQGSKQAQGTNAAENTLAQMGITRQQQGEQAAYGFQKEQFGLEQQGEAAQQAYSLGDIARGEQGLGLAAQANGLSVQQLINQTQYGMGQAGYQASQQEGGLYGQVGQAIGQGAQYSAGAIGYSALLGGANLNQIIAQYGGGQ